MRFRLSMPTESWPEVAAILAVIALVAQRIATSGIQVYGTHGSAWIEHTARLEALLALRGGVRPGLLDALDGEFPPGLHLLTLVAGVLTGHGDLAAASTGPLWMLALAAGVGMAAFGIEDRRAGLLAAALLCLLPAVHGMACRYYYDLPAMALVWLAAGAVVAGAAKRPMLSWLAASALGSLAWSVKWWALPVGVPLILTAGLVARPGAGGRLEPRAIAVALAACTVMIVSALAFLHAAGPDDSFDQARRIMSSQDPLLADGVQRSPIALASARLVSRPGVDLAFYAGRIATSVASPLLLAGLLLGVVSCARRRNWRALALLVLPASSSIAFVLLAVPILDDRFVVPAVVAAVPAAAIGLSAWTSRGRRLPAILVIASGVLVAADFHLLLRGAWNAPLVLLPPSVAGDRPLDSSGDAGQVGGPYRARPAVVARGPFASSSVEDRGWTRRDEQAPGRSRERERTFAAVRSCRPACLGLPMELAGADVAGDVYWWRYRWLLQQVAGGAGGPAPPEIASLCGVSGPLVGGCDPDVVVLPADLSLRTEIGSCVGPGLREVGTEAPGSPRLLVRDDGRECLRGRAAEAE